jgi:hypothetical protein
MVNDITNRSGSELSTEFATSLITGIDNSRAETPVIGGGKPLLRLLKSGVWVFGQADDPVQEGSRWAVNPHTIAHGFTCWSDYPGNTKNELLGERMVPVTQKKPMKPDPVGGFEWKEQRIFQAKCILGDDEGVEVTYKTNSIGGMRAFDLFLGAVSQQARKDPAHIVAILELEVDDYQNAKYGQIFTPILKIVGWAGMDGEPVAETTIADKRASAAGKPRKPSLKQPVAAEAVQPVQQAAQNDDTPAFVPPASQRPGAAPKRQRPAARA